VDRLPAMNAARALSPATASLGSVLESHRSQAHRPRLRQSIDPGLPSPLRLIMPLWLPSHYSAEPDLLCAGIR